MFDEGISKEGDLIELGEEMGVIKKSGSFYSFEETRLGQGRENAKTFLKENTELAEQIEGMIRAGSDATMGDGHVPVAAAPRGSGNLASRWQWFPNRTLHVVLTPSL